MKAAILALAMVSFSLAATPNLVVFGNNFHGVCDVPELPEGEYYVEVWGGVRANHVIAMTSEGELMAWGQNDWGQCDIPGDLPTYPIVPISAAACLYKSCVVFSDGSARWWGEMSGSYGPSHPLWVTQVAANAFTFVFLRENGTLYAEGVSIPSPNQDWIYIAAGHGHFLGIKENGSVICWGDNGDGQCNVPSPNSDFVALAGGWKHSVGLKEDGSVVCWGSNFYGQCSVPAPNLNFVSVASGEYHTVALKESGLVKAWGSNFYGQCDINGLTGVEGVAAGASYSAALLPPPTGIDTSDSSVQGKVSLSAYPNPSRGTLSFSVFGGGNVEVYDISGRAVASVSVPESGVTAWSAPSAGVYFAVSKGSEAPATRFVVLD